MAPCRSRRGGGQGADGSAATRGYRRLGPPARRGSGSSRTLLLPRPARRLGGAPRQRFPGMGGRARSARREPFGMARRSRRARLVVGCQPVARLAGLVSGHPRRILSQGRPPGGRPEGWKGDSRGPDPCARGGPGVLALRRVRIVVRRHRQPDGRGLDAHDGAVGRSFRGYADARRLRPGVAQDDAALDLVRRRHEPGRPAGDDHHDGHVQPTAGQPSSTSSSPAARTSNSTCSPTSTAG